MKVMVSLEGTLSDPSHRYELKNESFEKYQAAVGKDEPNRQLINFLNTLNRDIIVYSMTPENLRPVITEWLLENGAEVDDVILKKKNDYRPEYEIKLSILESIDKNTDIVIENSLKVADKLREQGYLVLQL